MLFLACEAPIKELPVIGKPVMVNGKEEKHKIPDFEFVNQIGLTINNNSLKDQVYLADFFFTHCPSICPKVTKQMLRLHDRYKDNPKIQLVSYTLDPKRDTPQRLKEYADNLDVDHNKWWFLTGDKDELYDLSEKYFVVAYEDEDAPEGIEHSGKIIMVDQERHVRAFAEGTDPESVDKLMRQIDFFLKTLD